MFAKIKTQEFRRAFWDRLYCESGWENLYRIQQFLCIQFLMFSSHYWSFHNDCGLILLKLQILLTVHLHADTEILFVKLTVIVTYVASILLIHLFSTMIPFPRRVTWHATFSYVLLNVKLIMEGVTDKWKSVKSGCNGRKPAGGRPGWVSSQVVMELLKSVILFLSTWGNVEV